METSVNKNIKSRIRLQAMLVDYEGSKINIKASKSMTVYNSDLDTFWNALREFIVKMKNE